MEADEVYSELGDKISTLQDKVSEFQGTIDYLKESQDELKSTLDKSQEAIQQVNDLMAEVKSSGGAASDDSSSKIQALTDRIAAAETAIAGCVKKASDQDGFFDKLAKQGDDATKMMMNMGDTMKGMVSKAVTDAKGEILNIFTDGQKALMNTISDQTTKWIKDQKDSMWLEFKQWISDTDLSKPKPINTDNVDQTVRDIIAKVDSESASEGFENKVREVIVKTQADNAEAFEQKVRDIITKVQSEKTS